MSRSLNSVQLIGHVGKDPDVKSLSSTTIASFSIATTSRFKDKDGEWQDKTEWTGLKAFGKTAEIIRDYIKKGSQIYVEGRLETSSWEDRETGEKKYRTDVIVNEVIMLGGKSEGERTERATPKRSESRSTRNDSITDDDIPF